MLIKLENITTPVVLIIDGKETEYSSGAEAVKAIGSYSTFEAVDVTAKDSKIVIRLEPWKSEAPDNFIGEAAVFQG